MTPEALSDDVLSRRFYSVSESDTLSFCQGIFREHHPRALVVLDKRGRMEGMITERDILRSMKDPAKTKVRGVFRKTPHVARDQALGEIARLMVENDLKNIPAIEGGKIVGIITDDSLLRKAAAGPYGEVKVSETMTTDPITVDSEDSIAKAVSKMRDEGISRLPVIKEGKVAGIVTFHDVLDDVYGPHQRMPGRLEGRGEMVKPMRRPVSSIMTSPAVTVAPDETVSSAVKSMIGRDISSLVVTGPSGRLIGLVTKTDLLRPIAEASVVRPSIKLEISVKDPEGVEELDRDRLAAMLETFARKHEKLLANSVLSLYVKSHRAQKKGSRLVHCRVMASGPSGQFSAVGEGWGTSTAIREAMDNLERRIVRAKEIANAATYSERLFSETLGLLS